MVRANAPSPTAGKALRGVEVILLGLTLAISSLATFSPASAQSSTGARSRAVDMASGHVIEYEIRPDGYALWDDIVIGRASDIERYGLRLQQPLARGRDGQPDGRKQIQQNYPGYPLWSLPIPYQVDDPTLAPLVDAAIAAIEQQTVLSFVPRTFQTDFIEFVSIPGQVSTSHGIGRHGGMHLIEMGDEVRETGIVQHELLHALGFAHEQQRQDRDDYIELHRECIDPDHLFNFEFKYDTIPFGNYDFASVMHYHNSVFQTARGCATFTVKPGRDATVNVPNCNQHVVGQQCGVSPSDIAAINYFYAPYALKHVDLNQHGLTGAWYEPATSGQGLAVEVFPNQPSGTGQVFVSWFTHDSVIGGAERQRWYTLQGQVATGQPTASLTIYQNSGGNFNAPPATNPVPVGTATLSFATCSTGSLSYNFTDGVVRAGTIPLARLLPNVTCAAATPYPTHADFGLSGSWYGGAATSGQGFTAEVAPSIGAFFLSWFTYMPNGTGAGVAGQRWYTAQGAFARGLRTIPVDIYETTGGKFDSPTPSGQQTVHVGTGTMVFHSCAAAAFSYNFTGGSNAGASGTINLGRVGPIPPGCAS